MANYSGALLAVVGDAGSLHQTTQDAIDQLEAHGWTVTLKSDDDAFLDTDSNWVTGFDVAFVDESVSSTTLGTSGRDAAQGTVFNEGGGVDDWDLASSSADVAGVADGDNAEFSINHALGAGMAGNGVANENFAIATTDKELRHVDGPSSGAVGIASHANDTHMISSWLTGADLTTGTAAARRVFLGHMRWDTGVGQPEETASVLNDQGWALFLGAIEWCAENDITSTRQVAVPTSETTATGGWTGAVTSIDDPVLPETTGVYDSTNASGILVVELGNLTDPTNTVYHELAVAHQRSVSGGSPSGTMALHQGYNSEGDQGTIIASMSLAIDSNINWGGNILKLDSTEADSITDYDLLQVRIAYTANGASEMEIANIRFLIDGAPDAPDGGLLPIHRSNVYHQSRRHRESQIFA